MKKSDLKVVFGSWSAIASLFAPLNGGQGLTRSAVEQWGEDIPPLREYQLRELIPDIDVRIARAHIESQRA